jgi:hypothetical protein
MGFGTGASDRSRGPAPNPEVISNYLGNARLRVSNNATTVGADPAVASGFGFVGTHARPAIKVALLS